MQHLASRSDVSRKASIEAIEALRVFALLCGMLLCTPSLAEGPVNCTPSFVAEAQSRCTSEPTDEPCTLIYWEISGQPARCQLVGNTLVWWVGVPVVGTVIDTTTGEPTVNYTWVPLSVPKPPSDVRVR